MHCSGLIAQLTKITILETMQRGCEALWFYVFCLILVGHRFSKETLGEGKKAEGMKNENLSILLTTKYLCSWGIKSAAGRKGQAKTANNLLSQLNL